MTTDMAKISISFFIASASFCIYYDYGKELLKTDLKYTTKTVFMTKFDTGIS